MALEWMVVFAAAAFITLFVQLTTAQVYAIPSASMSPTLEVGDRILVNKWAYRFGDPSRGDIVVFTRPKGMLSADNDLVKRVIGLPGETVTIADNHVLIDGQPLEEPYLEPGTLTQAIGDHPCTPEAPCVVPKGHVWVMGDNRNDSIDSRYFDAIPTSSVEGEAVFRVWPSSRSGGI